MGDGLRSMGHGFGWAMGTGLGPSALVDTYHRPSTEDHRPSPNQMFANRTHVSHVVAVNAGESVLTTKAQTTTTAQTESTDLTRISSEGVETPVDPGVKPQPTAPSGTTGTGEVASPSLVIPSNPTPVKTDED
jgi:hypothetical protein